MRSKGYLISISSSTYKIWGKHKKDMLGVKTPSGHIRFMNINRVLCSAPALRAKRTTYILHSNVETKSQRGPVAW